MSTDDADSVSGLEAYTALKESKNSFYSIFFQAEGYHPPTIVRILVIGTYLALFGLFSIAFISAIDFVFLDSMFISMLPSEYVGDLIGYENMSGLVFVAAIEGVLFISTYVFGVLASKISLPYEDAHIEWAEKILPNKDLDTYYPPYEYWTDKVIDEQYLQKESIPSTAPPELREVTVYERFMRAVWKAIRYGVHLFYLGVTLQMVVLLNEFYTEGSGLFRNR